MPSKKTDSPQLDEKDQRILAELRNNAWIKYTELGKRVNLSPSAVQRRVERLVETGVIVGTRALTSVVDTDRPIHLFILVEFREDGLDRTEAFTSKIIAADEVVEAHYVTGETDMVIMLQVKDMSEYVTFMYSYINCDPNVRRTHTIYSLRPLKERAGLTS